MLVNFKVKLIFPLSRPPLLDNEVENDVVFDVINRIPALTAKHTLAYKGMMGKLIRLNTLILTEQVRGVYTAETRPVITGSRHVTVMSTFRYPIAALQNIVGLIEVTWIQAFSVVLAYYHKQQTVPVSIDCISY